MPCPALRNIPNSKIDDTLHQIILDCNECSNSGATLSGGMCDRCEIINKAFNRYAKSNIPVRYWNLEMNKDFKGDEVLREYYDETIKDIKKTYRDGKNICFAGSYGRGKTMVCANILKRVVEKGYSAVYITLPDIISVITSGDKYSARSELLNVDFLVIDELDPRYMGTNNASDFFGRTLEDILRTRTQNCLPTFMCTNSPNLAEGFTGAIKESLTSLMNMVETVIVLGLDYRDPENRKE